MYSLLLVNATSGSEWSHLIGQQDANHLDSSSISDRLRIAVYEIVEADPAKIKAEQDMIMIHET